uniref:Uncharacterized protein n=1 Tax=Anguilla anguilla TaxID=7936 RepID=A0A0E9WSD3_ANGAN
MLQCNILKDEINRMYTFSTQLYVVENRRLVIFLKMNQKYQKMKK